ncbi:MAG: TIGR02594 family protein [Bdellovibrio sp.]
MSFLKNLFYKVTSMFQKQSPMIQVPQVGWQEEWTTHLTGLIKDKILILETASDIEKIRPDYHSLSRENQIKVFVELIKATCYFESGYNPKAASVDVGTKENKDTWSVGLLQMSVVDQSNYGLRFGYSYEDLLKPLPNLTLGVAVLAKQVAKHGKLIIKRGEPGLYWATLCEGGRYDKSASIIKRVQELKFESQVIPKSSGDKLEKNDNFPVSETPWLDIALKEVGVTEVSNPKRVIEYHQATSLKAKDVKTPWCAAFANWVLMQAGHKRTNTAWARDFLDCGKTLIKPQKGCIMVFERNAPGGDSHVTFWTGEETLNTYLCVGGNQLDAVCVKGYAKSALLGCRWPQK